ncbi:MAG: cation diffusion facilitator family transporter [Bacteroidales bacterium]|nr:cation diffusion facilitator family transporter [Bacteroidales bacterium]
MAEKKHKRRRTHQHHQPVNEKNLLAATVLNLVISIVEIAGGFLSGSLALLSDALHNLSDAFATFIAYLATIIGKREANQKKTFGYKRLEIMAALINAVILIVMSVFLIKEAWHRWQNPGVINSMIMLVVGMIGLLANLYAVLILRKDAGKSINVKAAYIHLIGDSLSSVVVIIGGGLIQVFEITWIDPVITVLISIYIIRSGLIILKESVRILMQSAPEHLDLPAIKNMVELVPEVLNIHHIHAWMLTDSEVHLEAHVELNVDLKLSRVNHLRHKIEQLLRDDFGIGHITLQIEYKSEHDPHFIHHTVKR